MNLHVLLPLILVPAFLMGELARRIRCPAVVGQIAAGFLLGPAVLNLLPLADAGTMSHGGLHELAQIGICALLFRAGLDTRMEEFRPVLLPSAIVALVGMLLPFLGGFALARMSGLSPMAAAFVGATLTATSVGISVAVLDELRATSSREGLLILGAAILDDVFGLLLLSVLSAFARPGGSAGWAMASAFGQALAFISAGLLLGRPVTRAIVWLTSWSRNEATLVVLGFAYALLLAFLAEALGLAMILGAYVAGLTFSRHPDRGRLESAFGALIQLLTPLFFVLIGSSIAPTEFNPLTAPGREALVLAALLLAAAVLGKVLCASWMRRSETRIWTVGWGMVPRGEVGLVFANMALAANIVTSGVFSALILVLIATSIIGPIGLRATWRPQTTRSLGEGGEDGT